VKREEEELSLIEIELKNNPDFLDKGEN